MSHAKLMVKKYSLWPDGGTRRKVRRFEIIEDQPLESRDMHAEFKDKLANNYN